MSILVVGSVALDTVKTPLDERKDVLGGSATYFSISASFFNPVNLVAVVGSDFPSRHLAAFKKRGVDFKGLEVRHGKTFRWSGRYGWDFNEAKTLKTCLNVFSQFNPRIPDKYKRSDYIFLANIDPELQSEVLKQVSNPRLVACDTMNYWIENKPKALIRTLKKVDMLLLNDSEARQLTGKNNLPGAAKAIHKLGPKHIIIKKGEHGALLSSDNSFFCIPAFLLDSVVDPTGAGDTFAGGVIGHLAKSRVINKARLREAVVYGTVMATFAVSGFSVRGLYAISKQDINKRFKEFKKLTCF